MKHKLLLGAGTLVAGNGGIARVARMSARALIEAGLDVRLLSFLDQTSVPIGSAASIACSAGTLRFAVESHLAALTCSHLLFDSVGLARGAPRIPGLGRPTSLWLHGLEAWEGMRADYRKTAKTADLVLVNSHYTLSRHQQTQGTLSNPRVCWLATEEDAAPTLRANFAGRPTVLIVGRINFEEGQKGHTEIIACWPRVVAAIPDAHLVIAGGGNGLDALRALARASGTASSVEIMGFVPESDIAAMFAAAHVYAMPSRQEGFGIAYIEAMRYGLPVIASRGDAGQEINVDGKTGYNVELSRIDDLGDRLIYLLRESSQAQAMGEAGYNRWHTNFRYSCFAERFIEIWKQFSGVNSAQV